jgi:hypothetical protein
MISTGRDRKSSGYRVMATEDSMDVGRPRARGYRTLELSLLSGLYRFSLTIGPSRRGPNVLQPVYAAPGLFPMTARSGNGTPPSATDNFGE